MHFVSPTKGRLSMEEMLEDIVEFITAHPKDYYRLIIGTDSQPGKVTCFVTAVIIHREGKGARFYYKKMRQNHQTSFKQRIFSEASQSLELAGNIIDYFTAFNSRVTVEIHLDVGERGKTRELIQQVVAMINTSGFMARVKPWSYAASKVADRFTKH